MTTKDPAYTELTVNQISQNRDKPVVVDFWRSLGHLASNPEIEYIPFGLQGDAGRSFQEIERL